MSIAVRIAGAGLLIALGAMPAAAQDGNAWTLVADPAGDLLTASYRDASGVGLIVQCDADDLVVGLAGTSLTGEGYRSTTLERDGSAPRTVTWQSAADADMAISFSARAVRYLRDGGRVTVRSAADDTLIEAVLNLPETGEPLDRVLTACREDLSDDRDVIPDVDDLLIEYPPLEMPRRAVSRSDERQAVEISCLVRSGRLAECRSHRQSPENARAGELMAQRADGTRLRLTDAEAAEGRLLDVTVTGWHVRH